MLRILHFDSGGSRFDNLLRWCSEQMIETEQVWERMRGSLLGFFRHRVRDEHVAEDLLQNTFTRIHEKLPSLQDEERLVPWVFRIARRTLADFARSHQDDVKEETDEEPASAEIADDNLNREVEGWLRTMLAALPEEYREAVRLAEIEGWSQEAVASHLGLSLSGAKSRIQRGRARLRAVLLSCCHLDFDRRGNVIGVTRRGRCEHCSDC